MRIVAIFGVVGAVFTTSVAAFAEDGPDEGETTIEDCDSGITVGAPCDKPVEVEIVKDVTIENYGKKTIRPIKGEDPPPGYHVERRTRHGIWGGGIGVAAGGWLLSILGGSLAGSFEREDDYILYGAIPLVGPLVLAGQADIEGGGKVAFALLGGVQAAGLSMIIGGAFSKKTLWVKDDEEGWPPSAPEIVITPGYAGLRTRF